MTIRVSGKASLKVEYAVELDMTVEEFEALSQRQQDVLIDAHTNWAVASHTGEVEIDDDLDTVKVVE